MTLPFVLIMMLLLLGFVGFLGFSEVLSIRSLTQAAADAAALAGASQQRTSTVTLGGQMLCQLPVGIDPEAAEQAAAQYWAANVRGQPFGLVVTDPQNPLNVAFHPNAENATTVSVNPELRLDVLALRILGLENIHWRVYAEARIAARGMCSNPFRGPVFDTGGALPPGWPDPQARPVWNFPLAGVNAPSSKAQNPDGTVDPGWPVYFVRVFHLDRPQTVTLYGNADDWVQVQVDGQTVPGLDSSFDPNRSEWNAVKQGQVDLRAGDHVLVAKAENGAWGRQGANPARFVLAAYGSDGSLLFDTQPNAYGQGGRPQGKYDWASYSPANPDWTVYLDWRYPSSWISNAGALAQELADAGFTVRNADGLASWMRQAIQDNDAANTVAVFAQDVAPDTVADQEGPGALIRRYLDAGGNALWLGDVPFYYQGHANQPLGTTQWSQFGESAILGLPAAAQTFPGQAQATAATAAGRGYGIQAQGNEAEALQSVRPLDPSRLSCGAVPLAEDPTGGLSGWRLGFSPNPWTSLDCTDPEALVRGLGNDSPGFVRVYDIGLDGANGSTDSDALAIAGQLAGWNLQQPVSIAWRNPYSGPVFDQGPAGAAPWRRADWPDQGARWIWSFPLASANAPANWPVTFARLFTLGSPQAVTFQAAADDEILSWSVDGRALPVSQGCSWQSSCTATVQLDAGPHLLVVRAQNQGGSQRFRNPAGLILTASAGGQVLFDTQADGRWTSYTPPNPDWVVYSDPNYPAAYGLNADALAGYLAKAGFTVEDAPGLGAWMRQEIQSGKAPQSVAVLPQGVAPDTVADREDGSALVRQYLDAGGSVLWIGDVPFYYQGHRGGSTTWGNQGLQAILGVGDDARHWDRPATPQPVTAGMGYGIGLSPYGMKWADEPSTRAMPTYQTPIDPGSDGMNCQLENLATNPNGGSGYWRVGYWPNGPDALGGCAGWDQYFPQAWSSDAPGFIRIYDTVLPGQLDLSQPDVKKSVLEVAAQIAGWYPGQDTALAVALGSLSLTPNPAWAGETVQASVTATQNPGLIGSVSLELPWSQAPVQLQPQNGGSSWSGSFQAPNPACGPTGQEAGYWALDPRTQDLSGNGNDLAQRGGGFVDAGAPCGGQAFATSPATGGYLEAPSSPSLNTTGAGLTLDAWVYPTGYDNGSDVLIVLNKEGQYELGVGTGQGAWAPRGSVAFAAEYGPGNDWYWVASPGGVVPLNRWSEIRAAWDGSTVRFYVNGSPVGSVAYGNGTGIPGTSNALRIGARGAPGAAGSFFAGYIQRVAVIPGYHPGSAKQDYALTAQGQSVYGFPTNSVQATLTARRHIVVTDVSFAPAPLASSDFNGPGLDGWDQIYGCMYAPSVSGGALHLSAPNCSGFSGDQYEVGGSLWNGALQPGETIRVQVRYRTGGNSASLFMHLVDASGTCNQSNAGSGICNIDQYLGNATSWTDRTFDVAVPANLVGPVKLWMAFGFAPNQGYSTLDVESVRVTPGMLVDGTLTAVTGQPVQALVTVANPALPNGTPGPAQSVALTLPWNGQQVALAYDGSEWAGTFTAPGAGGTYQVTATAQSDAPETATGSGTLEVVQPISISSFAVSPQSTQDGSAVTLTASTTGPVTSIRVDLPWGGSVNLARNGSTWSGTATVPSGLAEGTYTLTATATSSFGATVTKSTALRVYHAVAITGFSLSPNPANAGDKVTARVTTTGPVTGVEVTVNVPPSVFSANWPPYGWSFTSPASGQGTLQITIWNPPSWTQVYLNDTTAGGSQYIGNFGNVSPQTFSFPVYLTAGHTYSLTWSGWGGYISWVQVTTPPYKASVRLSGSNGVWSGGFVAPGSPGTYTVTATATGDMGQTATADAALDVRATGILPGETVTLYDNSAQPWPTNNPPPANWRLTSPTTGTGTLTITIWNPPSWTQVWLNDLTSGSSVQIGPSSGFGNVTPQTFSYSVSLQAGHTYSVTYSGGGGYISLLQVRVP